VLGKRSRFINSVICALIGLFLAAASVGLSQDKERNSPLAEKTAEAKRKQILKEIAKLKDHEWAGDYFAGDGLGVNTSLTLAPEAGYVFEWHGCLGLYDRNFGAVTSTNNRIQLSFTFPNERKGFQGIAPEFIPVIWKTRHYLVPADDIIGFCNHVNEGEEPRTAVRGFYLLRRGDEKKAVDGLPTVPREFQPYLLSRPIHATITNVAPYVTRPSVVDWKFKDTLVTLNTGASAGLRIGMELVVIQPINIVESVRITKVEDTWSEALMTQTGEDEPGPKIGWELCTRAPWHAAANK
jgi:hypothetical protein